MKAIIKIFLTTVLLAMFLLAGCSVVNPGYYGMRWGPFGKGLKTDKVFNDGIVWHWPWNSVIQYNHQWQTYQEKIPILTADELHIEITVSSTLRPVLAELPALELEVGQNYYQAVVKPELYSLVRNIFSTYKYDVLSPKSPEIEDKILRGLEEITRGKHLEFDNVSIDHITYSPLVMEAIDKKLAVQQDIEQKDYEIRIAEKNAEIQRILARGQHDAQQIIDSGLTSPYLQYKALEVQDNVANSQNAKFYFIPVGKDGLPVIIDTND